MTSVIRSAVQSLTRSSTGRPDTADLAIARAPGVVDAIGEQAPSAELAELRDFFRSEADFVIGSAEAPHFRGTGLTSL